MSNDTQNLSDSFKFIQMNFWLGRLCYPILEFFKREQPDVFAAQEMLSGEIDISSDFCTAEALINRNVFDEFVIGAPAPYLGHSGYDFPMHTAVFFHNGTQCEFKKMVLMDQSQANLRSKDIHKLDYHGLLHAKLRLKDGALVNILTHHGRLVIDPSLPLEGRMGSEVNDQNFKQIADYIKTLEGPVILSGDFNMMKEAYPLQHLKDIGLTNLNDVHDINVGRNEFSWKPTEAVSHLFINDQVIPEEYRVAQDNVSDHLPLVLKCRVKRA